MEETKKKIKCPKCGNEMNHHADKIIADVSDENLNYYDDAFDEMLEEHYKCHKCGTTLSKFEKE